MPALQHLNDWSVCRVGQRGEAFCCWQAEMLGISYCLEEIFVHLPEQAIQLAPEFAV